MSRKLVLVLSQYHNYDDPYDYDDPQDNDDPYENDDRYNCDGLYEPKLITAEKAKILAFHLKQSSAINILEVRKIDIQQEDEDGLLYIAEALQTNSSVTKLWLTEIKLRYTESSGSALTKMLHMNKTLAHLNLSMNSKLSDSGACCIFKGLQYNTNLTYLNLIETGVRATDLDTAQSLTKMLLMNKSLTHLYLSHNSFLKTSACCIFEGLQHNTTLTHLDLSYASLATSNIDTARCLMKMLQVNKSLTHLDLSGNNTITDPGACYIFDGLQHNTSLIYLNLNRTNVTATDPNTARSLTTMLQKNKSLVHLELKSESISNIVWCIFEGLQQNVTLAELILCQTDGVLSRSSFSLNSKTANYLSKMLEVNKTLKYLSFPWILSTAVSYCIFEGAELHLNLCGVTINDSDAEHIAEGLKSNTSLQTLKIGASFFWEVIKNGSLELLKTNPRLKTIYTTEASEKDRYADLNAARQEKELPMVDIMLVEKIPSQVDYDITMHDYSDHYSW